MSALPRLVLKMANASSSLRLFFNSMVLSISANFSATMAVSRCSTAETEDRRQDFV